MWSMVEYLNFLTLFNMLHVGLNVEMWSMLLNLLNIYSSYKLILLIFFIFHQYFVLCSMFFFSFIFIDFFYNLFIPSIFWNVFKRILGNFFTFVNILNFYSLVRLVLPNTEMLISRPFTGLCKIWLLLRDRVRTKNFRNQLALLQLQLCLQLQQNTMV